jgi:hypothetical protein
VDEVYLLAHDVRMGTMLHTLSGAHMFVCLCDMSKTMPSMCGVVDVCVFLLG